MVLLSIPVLLFNGYIFHSVVTILVSFSFSFVSLFFLGNIKWLYVTLFYLARS